MGQSASLASWSVTQNKERWRKGDELETDSLLVSAPGFMTGANMRALFFMKTRLSSMIIIC